MNSSRRNFLRHSSCAALSVASASAAYFDLMKTAALAAPAQAGDYKALVCVFLYGGNDSHNMLVPRTTADYILYNRTRGSLSVPQAQLRALNFKDSAQREFGLHPSMPELQTLFNTPKKLALVANVGPLLRPLNRTEYRAKSKPLPPQLFSHSDQQVHWQTSWPDQQITRSGWGGRIADAIHSLNTNSQVSMNLSFAGSNTFQVGNDVTPYEMSSDGPLKLSGFDANPQTTSVISQAIRNGMYTPQPRTNLLEEAWNGTFRNSLDAGAAFRAALDAATALTTVFPTNNNLAKQLNMVAKVIAARNTLNVRRQIFFVTLDGFDTHGDQLAGHPTLLQRLSQALNAFYAATVEMGVQNQVTTFTASDFGRALKPNAGGTDHGWGAHHFVLGGAVDGGKIFGTFPNLTLENETDAGNGRLIPTTAVDQYAATLATWFGVSATDLTTVVPNIGNFAASNLGFVA
ncbi:MAG: DUF1501 domain-containing protein [Acidobacteria bacterium]|nr:DUF1501 domain-containing protein [Acidobacteriota bacterium]